MSYHVTSALLGTLFALVILYLVRQDHLRIRYSLWWLGVAAVSLVLGLFPESINWLGATFGVAYPPTLLFVVGIAALLVKILTMDIEHSRQERSLRRLAQRLAMYEASSAGQPGQQEGEAAADNTATASPIDKGGRGGR